MSQVINLNIVKPEPLTIEIEDKTLNLTMIPFGISFRLYDLIPIMSRAEKGENLTREDADILYDLLTEVFQISDNTITKDWVYHNISLARFQQIMPAIMKMIFEDTSKKNEKEEADFQESS